MALDTRETDVGSGKREIGSAVIEAAAVPVVRRMAQRAVVTESRLHVVGIGGAFVVRLVTGPAVGGGPSVLSIHVTGSATDQQMGSGQRELRLAVIKGRGLPGGGGVTLC